MCFFFQPIVCEALKIIVEYTKTVMFVWMFIEGMYLHNMLVVSVFENRPNFALFYLLGWGKTVFLKYELRDKEFNNENTNL